MEYFELNARMCESNIKKDKGKTPQPATDPPADKDTMRPEYDFSKAVRGVTAKRYAEGTNVVLLDPDVARIFPDARRERGAAHDRSHLASQNGQSAPQAYGIV